MSHKHASNKSDLNRNDELIQDYLLDLFEGGASVHEETVPISKFFEIEPKNAEYQGRVKILAPSILKCCSLVPTIPLPSSKFTIKKYSKVQAILILLNALYYLRRPLSFKVRHCFLDLAEQMINDYHYAEFKLRMTREGVFS